MKITQLPASSEFSSGDVLAIEISGKTYKLTGATLAAALESIGSYVTSDDMATTTADGLMSAADKLKLNGIAAGAQVNSITGVKGAAEGSYRTGQVSLTPANIGAVATTGGTISGNVNLTSSDFDLSQSDNGVAGSTIARYFSSGDANNHLASLIGPVIYPNGNVRLRLVADNVNSGGTTVSGGIYITIDKTGTVTYEISNPDAFRSAIAAPEKGEYNGNIDDLKTSGIYYLSGATGTGGTTASGKLYGMLLVAANAGSDRCVQVHINIYTDVAEFRRHNSNGWQAWKTFTLT